MGGTLVWVKRVLKGQRSSKEIVRLVQIAQLCQTKFSSIRDNGPAEGRGRGCASGRSLKNKRGRKNAQLVKIASQVVKVENYMRV